jgi:hypothetical protein
LSNHRIALLIVLFMLLASSCAHRSEQAKLPAPAAVPQTSARLQRPVAHKRTDPTAKPPHPTKTRFVAGHGQTKFVPPQTKSPPKTPGAKVAVVVKKKFIISFAAKLQRRRFRYRNSRDKGTVGLEGRALARVKNNSTQTVIIEDLKASNIIFVHKKTQKRHVLIHPCACGAACYYKNRNLGRRLITLKPGQSRVFKYSDFGCGGGFWKPPPPGVYRVHFAMRVFPPAAKVEPGWCRQDKQGRLLTRQTIVSCRNTLHAKSFWKGAVVSKSLLIDLRRTKTKWLK